MDDGSKNDNAIQPALELLMHHYMESSSMIQQLFSKMGVVGGLPFTGTTVLAFPSLLGCPVKHVT